MNAREYEKSEFLFGRGQTILSGVTADIRRCYELVRMPPIRCCGNMSYGSFINLNILIRNLN